ncbi:MAG: L-histidine N(alpha)-methyltransferase [Flavobacteriaceae bacterium]|nr:L-histidine N(alpha)-methyltransferase [Flavobacteriaceae bacterium]
MLEKFIKDVDKGLSSYEKSIPSKYFYDKNGDELFIKIMHLPEYYVTRAELEIFKHQTKKIITALEINTKTYFQLIEFGAGDGLKTKELLRVLDKENYKFEYVPIDISQNALNSLQKKLSIELPNVSIKPKQGDYFEALKLLKDNHHPKVVLFLGSNIGNMTDETASKFIYRLGAFIYPNDKLFLGVDLIKSQSIVLPAYNDSQGITKDFNLNLLKRINCELDANFEINNFYHHPEYSEKEGVVRSYLVSTVEQNVSIKKIRKVYKFKKGEKILTEISRKYNDETINEMIKKTDFKIIEKLSDSKKYFSNYVLVKS